MVILMVPTMASVAMLTVTVMRMALATSDSECHDCGGAGDAHRDRQAEGDSSDIRTGSPTEKQICHPPSSSFVVHRTSGTWLRSHKQHNGTVTHYSQSAHYNGVLTRGEKGATTGA